MINLIVLSIYFFLSLRYPPVLLAIFMSIGTLEAYGIGKELGILAGYSGHMIPICIAGVLWRLWKESRNGIEEHRAFTISIMTMCFIMW